MTNLKSHQQRNSSTQKPNIVIIGAGKVGNTFQKIFTSNSYNVTLIGRDIATKQQAISNAALVLITTTDQAIEAVCETISTYLTSDTIVSHCSGALNSDVLLNAKGQGCMIASSHPLNTFPSLAASLTTFSNNEHGTYLYCEGDKKALTLLDSIFSSVGFKVVEIPSNAKMAYHAACVFACNYLTILMDISLQTAQLEGINKKQFWQAIQPLVQSTLNNISEHGTTQSLSGPIARGDAQTVSSHVELLANNNSEISEIYIKLAQQALNLAQQQGRLSDDKLKALKTLLND